MMTPGKLINHLTVPSAKKVTAHHVSPKMQFFLRLTLALCALAGVSALSTPQATGVGFARVSASVSPPNTHMSCLYLRILRALLERAPFALLRCASKCQRPLLSELLFFK
jgi:hypothetical protein